MKIKLRQKANQNNTTSLFLEYYYGFKQDTNGKIKHIRKYDFLNIHLITKPKNAEEKTFNKDVLHTAKNILQSKQVESLKSDYDIMPDNKSKVKFIDYYTSEMDKRDLNKTSLTNYKSTIYHFSNFCNPDNTTLRDIDEQFILKFKKYLDEVLLKGSRKLRNNTKHFYISVIKSIINQAYKSDMINKNPFNSIKNYKIEETEKSYLTFEEIQKLKNTECSKPLVKQAFLFSCFCGLRFSDVMALKWNQVIEENGQIKLNYRQVKTKGQEYLDINKQAVEFLGKRGNPDEQVFKGLKYDLTINNALLKWVLKAGINKAITFHSARHTFATLLISNGVDIYKVSKLLGHKKISTTEVYAKIINPKMIEAVNKIPKLK